MKRIEIGVRDLVDYVLRSGSIDSRKGSRSRMQEGTLFHQMIQEHDSEIKENYESEVFFSHDYEYDDYLFCLTGRADAMYTEDGEKIIEEIKTTRRKKSDDFKAEYAHLTQLRFYGFFYLLENNLEAITLRLHYYHTITEEHTYFEETITLAELKGYVDAILKKWLEVGTLKFRWNEIRDETIKDVPFVFGSFRRGQREMSLAVYNTIKRNDEVLIEAPTGIGKTAGTLFPAIKSLLFKDASQIYYLTAKTTIQREARKALDKMRELGLSIRSTTLTAKDKICFLNQQEPGSRSCNPEDCKYAKEYFSKLLPVLVKTLNSEDSYTREIIEKIAFENEICPFEFSMELANWSDVVICDYNYVFDPLARIENLNSDRIYLIDEAHNLTDRAREMYSIVISLKKLEELVEAIQYEEEDIEYICRNFVRHLNRTIRVIRDLGDEIERGEYILELEEEDFSVLSDRLFKLQEASLWLYTKMEKKGLKASQGFQNAYDEVMGDVYKCSLLLDYIQNSPESFHIYLKKEFGDVRLRIACLDPSKFVEDTLSGQPAILFSATLTPFDYYNKILLNEDVPSIAIPSPFDRKKVLVLYDDSISTRYVDREDSYERIAKRIKEMTDSKEGHYITFFPSYAYLKEVLNEIEPIIGEDYEILVQQVDMSDEERNAFIARFKEDKKPLLGMCVMGGVFSEGLDLPLDSLIGTIIVGPGLPGLDYERDLLKEYFDEVNDNGYAYAYAYPGMNRVLQSAGRVIRTEEDRGVILFIDDRFGNAFYNKMIPKHLKPLSLRETKRDMGELLQDFWNEQEFL